MANTSTEIRNLQFASNNPGAILNMGRQQSQAISQQVPDDAPNQFNTMLMDLLKEYQTLGTKPFVEQELNAKDEAARRTFQTPQDLIGASPALQSGARNSAVAALSPTTSSARESRQTYSEQLKSFGDSISNIRTLLKDQEESTNKRRDDARSVIKDALTLGGADALNDLGPEEILKLEKTAGYPKGYIQGLKQTIKDRELALKDKDKPIEISPGSSLIDPNTGEVLYSAPEKDAVQKDQAAAALKQDALKSANELVNKLTNKKGTSAVGKSGLFKSFGYGFIPGTERADFEVQFKNLKSLLSLDNVKYLKGQGQVSDAERDLLASAAAKLELSQSEPEFKKALQDVVKALSGGGVERLQGPDGKMYDVPKENVDAFLKSGGKRINFNPGTSSGSRSATGMRTDRHNNPTAFTTDVARVAGLQEGVDYAAGDPFGGGKYKTARILGDPIATTIKVIDRIGFTTGSGQPRWNYINIPKSQWDNLSYQQKKSVIAQMYQREGGSQLRNLFA